VLQARISLKSVGTALILQQKVFHAARKRSLSLQLIRSVEWWFKIRLNLAKCYFFEDDILQYWWIGGELKCAKTNY